MIEDFFKRSKNGFLANNFHLIIHFLQTKIAKIQKFIQCLLISFFFQIVIIKLYIEFFTEILHCGN
jgi:hypothetical protein